MVRLLPALFLAVMVHVALLRMDVKGLLPAAPVHRQTEMLTIALVDRSAVAPTPSIRSLPPPPPALPPLSKSMAPPKPMTKNAQLKKQIRTSAPKAVQPPAPAAAHNRVAAPAPPQPVAFAAFIDAAIGPAPAVTSPPAAGKPETHADDGSPPAAQVQAVPRYADNPPPLYPRAARRRGYAGTVIIDVYVEADGRVGDLRVATSSNYALLDQSAMQAVRTWVFEPGRQGDKATAMWVQVPVEFRLQ